jgi:FkbM family methyltransferase
MHFNQNTVHFFHRAKLLKYLDLVTEVHFPNRSYRIPISKGIGYSHCLRYESWLMKIMSELKTFLHNNRSFIDVGVNVGQTLLLLKSVYPEVRYIGFEPNRLCIEYTKKLISSNNIENTTLYPWGLSDETREGDLNFYHRNADDASASILTGFRADQVTRRSKISLIRADDLKEWTSIKPGIIKIDVEGFELEVLTGLAQVIADHRPCIICEILPAYSERNTFRVQRQEAIRNLLMKQDYSLYHISETGAVRLIDGFSVNASINACNYLFIPNEDILKVTLQ